MPKAKIAVRDKFYTLAKEQGYRARSAFKLIQLNRKFNLLDDSTRAIDLCAAPGGWLQVLAKAMPPRPDRQIIGVDLLPIKPLKGVVTFQCDITTAECRRIIRHELKGNQADVVLCDGAPNVGSAFGKDAFVQSELALAALRFATDHLKKGGDFVTKVFRSSDYNALIWCFQQFFRKVEATKPASSRNVSAEIFVVCRDYLAPDKIDPRLLDSKYVFAQVKEGDSLDGEKAKLPVSVLLAEPKKNAQKKFRVGYDEDAPLFQKCNIEDFIYSEDPVRILIEKSEFFFPPTSPVTLHASTTTEIKHLCEDLKVIGRADFKTLLKWRSKILVDLKKNENTEDEQKDDKQKKEEEEEEDDETKLGKALLDLEESRKKQDKKQRKVNAKEQRKRDAGLIHPYAVDLADREVTFDLRSMGINSTKDSRLDEFRDVRVVETNKYKESDDEEDEDDEEEVEEEDYSAIIEKQLDLDFERFSRKRDLSEPMTVQERRRVLFAEKKAKKKKSALEQMTANDFQKALEEAKLDAYKKGVYAKMLKKGIDGDDQGSSGDEENDEEEEENEDMEEEEEKKHFKKMKEEENKQAVTKRWFQQSLFHNPLIDDEAEEIPLPSQLLDKSKRREKRQKVEAKKERKKLRKEKEEEKFGLEKKSKGLEYVAPPKSSGNNGGEDKYDLDEDVKESKIDAKHKNLIEKGIGKRKKENENAAIEFVPSKGIMDDAMVEEYDSEDYDSDEHAQHLALGALLAKKSTRSDLLDSAYNRYSYNDGPLPAWFAEDESRHNRPNLPITKEMIESVKARFSDMNDRPIKKVAEARARKRKRAQLKIQEAKRKASAVVDEPDLSSRSKMRTIEKLFKGTKVKRPASVYVVSQKGGSKNSGGKSTKGKRVKVVDPRLKKDTRGKKRAEKKQGGKKRKH